METKSLHIHIEINRDQLRWLLALIILCASVVDTASESLTLTTTYPAPVGVYTRVITTGAVGLDTTLARDGGNVVLLPATNAAGRVGIGTSAPAAKLDVAGTVKIVIDGSQAAGMVLNTDASGNASWNYCAYGP